MRARNKKPYTLINMLVFSTAVFSALGIYTGIKYYSGTQFSTASNMPLAIAMQGLHDGLYKDFFYYYLTGYETEVSLSAGISGVVESALIRGSIEPAAASDVYDYDSATMLTALSSVSGAVEEAVANRKYEFTTVDDDYFDDACFIGDSRTVGISDYSGIEGATFLCRSSLTIYDYDKPKISYDGETMSIRDVLSERQFAKIYIMVGINECGTGTPETFFESYRKVVEDIRRLQPDALIFIQGNLYVTEKKSKENKSFSNDNISARNDLIATLANQKDIFYIDINESSLCDNNSLVSDYTWDQVHIKAQYYGIWKTFLLEHAIVR